MSTITNIIRSQLKLVLELSKNDFKNRYAGSFLGIIWAFIQPLMTIAVYWFVFEVGFRSGNRPDGTPFILWLTCGMIPWFFFSEGLLTSSNSFLEYSYLVKKINFRIGLLPIVKIVSSFFIHIFFLILLIGTLLYFGYYPDLVYIQVFYYLFCTFFLLIGLSLIMSSLVVFIKDALQVLGIFMQIGFWLIPIVWSPEIISDKFIMWFKLNPVYYLVEGYRDTFINHVWFWHRYNQTTYFWVVSIFIFLLGVYLFRKLKPHFADVL
ncbi:ABC transporter permease [Paenibacillus glacialis]|uniref:Transport permease protein n=1 Tax=Paenibacillus glacialis TaxID=494026 RepID=A0A168L7N4_9BACL|nr:ABC transporter permease [Paenibacillus glacialis]OAB42991.1 teichoic acid ABC transporter permease [Paenibacillus glacialis]